MGLKLDSAIEIAEKEVPRLYRGWGSGDVPQVRNPPNLGGIRGLVEAISAVSN
jgi:hypothetical protein